MGRYKNGVSLILVVSLVTLAGSQAGSKVRSRARVAAGVFCSFFLVSNYLGYLPVEDITADSGADAGYSRRFRHLGDRNAVGEALAAMMFGASRAEIESNVEVMAEYEQILYEAYGQGLYRLIETRGEDE